MRISPTGPLLVGTLIWAVATISNAYQHSFASVPYDTAMGIATLCALVTSGVWWWNRAASLSPELIKFRADTLLQQAEAELKSTKQAANQLADAFDRLASGPSFGIKPDGSGGYVGFMPTDYFETYSVCPACGLEAAHDLRPPHVEEGHDQETSGLKYWKASNVGHAMRDYEVIRTCKRCAVHWGQNALGIFPAPLYGPFYDQKAKRALAQAIDRPDRIQSQYTSAIEREHATFSAMMATPRHDIGQALAADFKQMPARNTFSGIFTRAEQEALMAEEHDNLPAVPDKGDIVSNGYVILPDPVADARAKTDAADRDAYKRSEGKTVIAAGGYVIAEKDGQGRWAVPETPTKVVREDGTVAETSLANEAWAHNFAKAQGDQTLDLTAGAPQGWLPSTTARAGLNRAEPDEAPPPTGPDTHQADIVDPRTASLPIRNETGDPGHLHTHEWGFTDPALVHQRGDDPETVRRANVAKEWDTLDHDRQESELDKLQADLDKELGR
jgi:hypothetical protein